MADGHAFHGPRAADTDAAGVRRLDATIVTFFIAAPEASHLDARIAALMAGWVLSVPSVIWLNVLVRRRRNRAIAKRDQAPARHARN